MSTGEISGVPATEAPLPPIEQRPDGRWFCSLGNGIIIDLGTTFNPQEPSEYERRTIEALQTEKGVAELMDSKKYTGPRVQIGESGGVHWYAWGGMTGTKTGEHVFHLGRLQI